MSKLLVTVLLLASAGVVSAGGATAVTKPAEKADKAPVPKSGEKLPAGFRPCIRKTRQGSIDWTTGQILARGVGKVHGSGGQAVSMGRRAARLVAARNAVLMIAGLPIDPEGKNLDVKQGKITVAAALRDFEETAIQYDPGKRTVTVTLLVPLYGVEGLVRKTGVIIPRRGGKWPWPKPVVSDKPSTDPAELIVVDARGTKFTPVMFPTLQSRDGRRVFDAGDLPRRRLFRRPMVIYASADRKLDLTDKPATKPAVRRLVLRPARSKGRANGTLVLGEEDLVKLAAHPEAEKLLKAGKVVILTGTGRK